MPTVQMAPQQAADRTLALAQPATGRKKAVVLLLLAFVLLLGVLILDLWLGEPMVEKVVTPSVVFQALMHHITGNPAWKPLVPTADNIVWQIRLPRAIGAVLVGALLALVGAAFQSLLMNPLADPYTVGVASGSGMGSVAVILLGGSAWLGGYAQTVAAFVCGLAAVWLVYRLSQVNGRTSPHTFLLAGTVVGAFFWSLIPLMVMLGSQAGENRQARILTALFGSLEAVGWRHALLLAVVGVVGTVALWRSAPELDLMAFGEETALHLGVDTHRFRLIVLSAGTLLTAAAVAVAGVIAFVGFVAPHAARRLVGPAHRRLLPCSALVGAIMLVASDMIARVWLHDVPVGVVTSLFGIPLYATLLRKSTPGRNT